MEFHVARALAYHEAGRHDLSIADISRAIELYPKQSLWDNESGLYLARASIYRDIGKYDLALRDFDRSFAGFPTIFFFEDTPDGLVELGVEFDGENPPANIGRALLYAITGEFGLANRDYDSALAVKYFTEDGHLERVMRTYTRAIEGGS